MNDDFEKNLQQKLRNGEDGLDAPTAARLHAARNRAVESASGSQNMFWNNSQWLRFGLPATATACAILAAIFVALPLVQEPGQEPGQQADELTIADSSGSDSNMDELSLLEFEASLLLAAEADGLIKPSADEQNISPEETQELLDLYENLEFYEWLALEEMEESA
jgi:hypothetical protein